MEVLQTTLSKRGSRGQYPNVVGELVNRCAEPMGIQLMATFRDKEGKVVSTTSFWPASTSDIPGMARWPFDHPGEADTDPSTAEVRVIGVKRWH